MSEVSDALDQFGERRVAEVRKLVSRNARDPINPPLILAMGIRESGLRNIVGDYGHGRGFMQIDDRWQVEWLDSVRACDSGSWKPKYDSALPAGRVPALGPMVLYAVHLLHGNLAFARRAGVPQQDRLRFAVAAYNCGPSGALAGYRAGDVDQQTAWGNYSEDVFKKRPTVKRWLTAHDK